MDYEFGNNWLVNNITMQMNVGVARLAYWHPLKTNAFAYVPNDQLGYEADITTGPIGIAPVAYGGLARGGVPSPVAMADAFWGTGF